MNQHEIAFLCLLCANTQSVIHNSDTRESWLRPDGEKESRYRPQENITAWDDRVGCCRRGT